MTQPHLFVVRPERRRKKDRFQLDERTRQLGLDGVARARALLQQAAERAARQQDSTPAA